MPFAKIRRPHSLRARLQVMFIGGVLASAALITLVAVVVAEPFSRHMLNKGIHHYTQEIADHVRFNAQGVPVGLDEQRIEPWLFGSLSEEVTLRILDEHGQVVYSTEPGGGSRALAPEGGTFDPSLSAFRFLRNGIDMHGSTARVAHQGRTWWLQFATSDRLVLRMRASIGMPAVAQGVAATCAAFLLLFFVTVRLSLRQALKPLREASADARRITPRTLDARLNEDAHPVEIRPLVQAFNQTMERLQHGFRTQQEFLASAAHELKTPLALLRAQVELGPRDERSHLLLQDLDHMARQVQQLLMLAEVSEPQNYRIEPMDPRGIVQEVFDYMGRVAERHGVLLALRIDDGLRQWLADRGALFTLLKNLLENAIQHSPRGGVVTLTVSPSGFVVRDHGPGLPDEHLPRIFERFWRGPDRREEGAGLGLSICLEIATAHRWRLMARQAEPGLAMCAEVLPAEDVPEAVAAGRLQAEVPRRSSRGKAMAGALF